MAKVIGCPWPLSDILPVPQLMRGETDMAFEEGKEGEREKLRSVLGLDRSGEQGCTHNSEAVPQSHDSLRGVAWDRLEESGSHAHGLSDSPGESQTCLGSRIAT